VQGLFDSSEARTTVPVRRDPALGFALQANQRNPARPARMAERTGSEGGQPVDPDPVQLRKLSAKLIDKIVVDI